MATFLATSSASPMAALSASSFPSCQQRTFSFAVGASVSGLKCIPKPQISLQATASFARRSRYFRVSCSAQPETLETVQSTIAKQLSIDVATVSADTKFADLGADSLDTVEIMMALEEQFGVSIGEGGAENVATVQDAADLIEKVKKATAA